MIKKLLIIYIVGAVCAFAAMVFFLRHNLSKEDQEEFAYYDCGYCDYEYTRIVFGILETIISIFLAVLWPFIPVFMVGIFVFDWVREKFPGLMGHLSDEKEDADGD